MTVFTEAYSGVEADVEERPRHREPEQQLGFRGNGSYILFTCIIPVILGFLGLALIFVASGLNPLLQHPGGRSSSAGCVARICGATSFYPATEFCSHLILTPWGTNMTERERSQREFLKAAAGRARLYLTIDGDQCPQTTIADLLVRLKVLQLTGYEFYLKGNETADGVKACFDIIDQLVGAKSTAAVILRSGPYGTQVKANVLANVYQMHAHVDGSGTIHDAIFMNNFNYTDPNQPATSPALTMVNILSRATSDRAKSIAAGGPNVTNICYTQSLMGIRVDTRAMLRYSEICEMVQCCSIVKPPQSNDLSRSRIVSVKKGSRYLVSYDDPVTLEEKANDVAAITGGRLCIAADDADADDFHGKCGDKAALLSKMAQLAGKRNTAYTGLCVEKLKELGRD
ncbi:hypothetical protein MTO96_042560 [Rhipicephalus appendiculatus]